MGRSQDFMNPFWDGMFPDEPNSFHGNECWPSEDKTDKATHTTPAADPHKPLTRRILPIFGAILGDIIGSRFERDYPKFVKIEPNFPLFTDESKITDDTVFTIAIADALLDGVTTTMEFTSYLVLWGGCYPDAGYGRATQAWIKSPDPQPYSSNRNGAAMRVSPCACFADSLDQALQWATDSAMASHNTPEGVAGAKAIAAAVYMAIHGATKDEIRNYIEENFGYLLGFSMAELRNRWSGFSCKASDTVPQAIMCFLNSSNVESTIRNAISLCSDADTLASMAAAIAAPYYQELPFWNTMQRYIPADVNAVLKRCNERFPR